MPRPRDTQRSKVYSLKPSAPESSKALALFQCEQLIKDAHERYGVTWTGRITNGGGTRVATGSRHRINLPVWARTPETVLHEAAHAIIDRIWPWGEVAAHGPEYARVLLELWAWAKLDTLPALRSQARAKRVKVAQDARCVPPKVSAVKAYEKARAKFREAEDAYRTAKEELAIARAALRPK